MPANDWHMLVAAVVGIVVLFVFVIVLGLRYAARNQAKLLRETRARDVLTAAGLSHVHLADLLYGVWQTRMTDVVLQVRDGNDSEVATIVQRSLGGGTITIGDDRYSVVVTSGWRESALLVRDDDRPAASAPLCRCKMRGWGGGRTACYTLADGDAIRIRSRWSLPWSRAPLPILRKDSTVGHLFGIGGATNAGRAVVLPSTIALPVRLFILYKAGGAQRAGSAAH